MTTPTPGWYRDPRDESKLRWWDGATWTSNQRPREAAPPPAAPPHSAAPTALPAAPVRAALSPATAATPPATQVTATSAPMMFQPTPVQSAYSRPAAVAVVPPVVIVPPTVVASASNELATIAPLRGPWNDLPLQATVTPDAAPKAEKAPATVWNAPHVAIAPKPSPANAAATTLAVLPAVTLVLTIAGAVAAWIVAPELGLTVPIVLILSFVARWVLGARDRASLAKRGYPKRPALALVLLPLVVYFVARGVVLRPHGGRGFGPLLLLILSTLLTLAAVLGLGLIAPVLTPAPASLELLTRYLPGILNLSSALR